MSTYATNSVNAGKFLSPIISQKHLPVYVQSSKRYICVKMMEGCILFFCLCAFSKEASSNSYFGLRSFPDIWDNGTVLSVLNNNC